MGTAVQIINIGERSYSLSLLLRLNAHAGCQQGWTGNLAYRAFSRWADALSGRYMFLNIYLYSSKWWWAAWTKKMPGTIFLSQSSPGCQISVFILPLSVELFVWMPRLFRSGRICDLWLTLFTGFHGCNTLFSANWQPGVSKYCKVNTQTKT